MPKALSKTSGQNRRVLRKICIPDYMDAVLKRAAKKRRIRTNTLIVQLLYLGVGRDRRILDQ